MLSVIKETVKQTIEVEKLSDFTVGEVLSDRPIKVQITQKLILGENQLVLPEKLTDHFIYMTEIEMNFNDIKDKNKYDIRKKYIIYNALKAGDKVILARKAGGQKYFVIDRMGVT